MRILLLILLATPASAADADGLLKRWLAAQNSGDFPSYSKLYAERFSGVKRSGPKTYQFDRKGWLKDRQRMFRKKMVVGAEAVKTRKSGTTVVLDFTQTWASGTYKDVGPKRLLLVPGKKGLRISREEMLRSERAGTAKATPLDPEDFHFMFEGLVYLGPAKSEWAGKPTLHSRQPVRVSAPAVKAPDAQKWLGRELEVRGKSGKVCRGRISELRVLMAYIPHFFQVQTWEEDKATDEQIARAAIAEGGWLMAKVAGCESGLWAGKAKRFPALKVNEALKKKTTRAFKALPTYKALQKQYARETGNKTPWELDDGGKLRFAAFRHRKQRYVAIEAGSGMGCGNWIGSLWAIFRETPTGLQVLTGEDAAGGYFLPEALLELDGQPAFTAPGKLVRPKGPTHELLERLDEPDHDCPC